jgi:hypothetical protein
MRIELRESVAPPINAEEDDDEWIGEPRHALRGPAEF